jgi:hypothetical protein
MGQVRTFALLRKGGHDCRLDMIVGGEREGPLIQRPVGPLASSVAPCFGRPEPKVWTRSTR